MVMEERTAIVIGATGLVGTELVKQLLADDRFRAVIILARRSTGRQHEKLEEHLIDFDQPDSWKHLVRGNVLFSALGTTLKQAGSKQAQYKIDYHYQYHVAAAAASNGVPVYVLVSSAMANETSRIFYTRMKGELERDVKKLGFRHLHILQPGMLAGNRQKKRTGEVVGLAALKLLNAVGIARRQKPVDGGIVARAMINASFLEEKENTFTLLDVFRIAGHQAGGN